MPIQADRLRKWIIYTLIAAGGYFFGFGGRYTVVDLWRVKAAVSQERAAVADLEVDMARLDAHLDSLATSEFILEKRARERYGLVRQGEILLRFGGAEPGP